VGEEERWPAAEVKPMELGKRIFKTVASQIQDGFIHYPERDLSVGSRSASSIPDLHSNRYFFTRAYQFPIRLQHDVQPSMP